MTEEDKGLQLLTPYKIDLLDGLAFGLALVVWVLL